MADYQYKTKIVESTQNLKCSKLEHVFEELEILRKEVD